MFPFVNTHNWRTQTSCINYTTLSCADTQAGIGLIIPRPYRPEFHTKHFRWALKRPSKIGLAPEYMGENFKPVSGVHNRCTRSNMVAQPESDHFAENFTFEDFQTKSRKFWF